MGVVLLGMAAVLAVFLLTRAGPGAPAGSLPAPRPPEGVVPGRPLAAPTPPPPSDPQPPGSVAAFDSPEDRADAMAEVQRRRLENGMDALNQRGARRAAQARQAPAPSDPPTAR
jgi:hypothetical protein